ncbi:hypothetical protein BH23BAC4_BH23BAC4_10370 [soil metagenome]
MHSSIIVGGRVRTLTIPPVVWVAGGSALGGVFRYGATALNLATIGPSFPLGTLAVNVAGSLIVGIVAGLAFENRDSLPSDASLFLTAGFCGGLTTYSFFSWQTVTLWQTAPLLAVTYLALTLVLGIGAAWVGFAAARRANRGRSL